MGRLWKTLVLECKVQGPRNAWASEGTGGNDGGFPTGYSGLWKTLVSIQRPRGYGISQETKTLQVTRPVENPCFGM